MYLPSPDRSESRSRLPRVLLGLLAPLALAAVGCVNTIYRSNDDEAPFLIDQVETIGEDVYLLSPQSDSLVRVNAESLSVTDIEVGRDPRVLERPPGADALFTVNRRSSSLSRFVPGSGVDEVEIDPNFNTLVWSPDGRYAVAWIDPDGAVAPVNSGSLNLNEIAIIDAQAEPPTVERRTLTYRPTDIAFDPLGERALISTTDRLLIFDMESYGDTAVRFAADEGTRRGPRQVIVDPTGELAVVSVEGVTDLFLVATSPVFIENVIGISRTPTDMAIDHDGRRLIIADGTSRLTFIDLLSFDVETHQVDHAVNRISLSNLAAEPFALLYADNGVQPQITWMDLADEDLVPGDEATYLLQRGVRRVELAPDDRAAVIFHQSAFNSTPGYTDSLSLFNFDTRGPSHILLDAPAWDLDFLPGPADTLGAVVVLRDSDKLVVYDLDTYDANVLPTYGQPTSLGLLPEGRVWVLHDSPLGLVSFVDDPWSDQPPPGGFRAVTGLGLSQLLDD